MSSSKLLPVVSKLVKSSRAGLSVSLAFFLMKYARGGLRVASPCRKTEYSEADADPSCSSGGVALTGSVNEIFGCRPLVLGRPTVTWRDQDRPRRPPHERGRDGVRASEQCLQGGLAPALDAAVFC